MYAIIRAGGKQAKVRSGDIIEVERVRNAGDTVEFSPLLVVDESGMTHNAADLAGAKVTAKVLGEVKGDKIHIFKYKNKTGYSRRAGHRQTYTRLEITDISLKSKKASGAKKPAKAKAELEPAASEEE